MSLRQITNSFTKNQSAMCKFVTSSIKRNQSCITSDLVKLEKTYNNLTSFDEDDYRLFLHANFYSTKQYEDNYQYLVNNIKDKIEILKN